MQNAGGHKNTRATSSRKFRYRVYMSFWHKTGRGFSQDKVNSLNKHNIFILLSFTKSNQCFQLKKSYVCKEAESSKCKTFTFRVENVSKLMPALTEPTLLVQHMNTYLAPLDLKSEAEKNLIKVHHSFVQIKEIPMVYCEQYS
jgi:hypothetical protein